MNQLTIHPASQKTLGNLQKNLPQSLLLSGERGVGLMTIAIQLADKNLAGEIVPIDAKNQIDHDSGTITVEMIRRLYEQTRAKYTARQIVIIDDADRMSHGAQNAFLKLLEEPNEQIYFILTSHQPQLLLPTIRSRVQQTVVHTATPQQSAEFIDSLNITDSVKKTQLQFIATGLPAELARLTSNEDYFKQRAAVFGDARDFLQTDIYGKLLIAQKYKSSRVQALQLCDSAMHILRRTVSAKPQPALISQLERLLDVRERIAMNHNIALQLAEFVV